MPAPRQYPPELRDRAVELVLSSGRPIAHIADELGINRETLRCWVRQAQADRGQRADLLSTDEREELKRLRRENIELHRTNEILKLASAFFAQELCATRRWCAVRRWEPKEVQDLLAGLSQQPGRC